MLRQGAHGAVIHNDDTEAKILEFMTGASQSADPSRTGMFTTGIFSRLEKHSAELDLSPERWMPWNYRDNLSG